MQARTVTTPCKCRVQKTKKDGESMRKYRFTFEFKKTEEEARQFCNNINKNSTAYMRKNKPAHFTPWSSQDGKENLFACFYYV